MLRVLKVKLHRAESNVPNHLEKEFKQKNVKYINCSYCLHFLPRYFQLHLCMLTSYSTSAFIKEGMISSCCYIISKQICNRFDI